MLFVKCLTSFNVNWGMFLGVSSVKVSCVAGSFCIANYLCEIVACSCGPISFSFIYLLLADTCNCSQFALYSYT